MVIACKYHYYFKFQINMSLIGFFSLLNSRICIPVHRSSVRVGEFDTSTDPDCATSGFCAPSAANHLISHVIVHPDYVSGQYHHDIALIVLKTALNYTGKPSERICLCRYTHMRDAAQSYKSKSAIIVILGIHFILCTLTNLRDKPINLTLSLYSCLVAAQPICLHPVSFY